MRITIDARMIESSGIGTFLINILKRIILKKQEWFFYIIGNRNVLNNYQWLNRENVKIINCDVPIYSVKEQFIIPVIVPRDSDLLWVPHFNIPLFYHRKLIVTIHDVFHLAMPKFISGIHKKLYAKIMFNMIKIKADRITTVSNFTKEELKKYLNIDTTNVDVIYSGVDEEWFKIDRKEKVHKAPYILYVGNVKPHKNLITLVKAFLKIKNEIIYDLIIVGKKEGFITGDPQVVEYASSAKDRILFTGFIDKETLKQYYKQAAVFVFPSLYEGFGLPPLEALAAGCPRVLCSNAASIPEVCGDMVEYFNPLDVEALANCIKLPETQSKRGHEKFFDWQDCVDKIVKCMDECIKKDS